MADYFKFDLEDAKVAGFGKNFSGRGTEYNSDGDRNFIVFIDDPRIVDDLEKNGCNVKFTREKEDGEGGIIPARAYIKCKIKYRKRNGEPVKYPPKVYKVCRNRQPLLLREQDLDELDGIFIDRVSGSFTTWEYSGNLGSGKAIYTDELWVETSNSSRFADKYANYEHPTDSDEDEVPFN